MKFISYQTLRRGSWLVRVSIMGTENILIVAHNEVTLETLVRSYSDEMDAHIFLEYIAHKHMIKDDGNYDVE